MSVDSAEVSGDLGITSFGWRAITCSLAGIFVGVFEFPWLSAARIELSSEGTECIDRSVLLSNSEDSKATSRSHVLLKSSDALRNSARFFPSERLNWGNFRGPKNTRAMIKMKSSSVLPRESRISRNTS